MIYIEAPTDLKVTMDTIIRGTVFLAGGITGCPQWQHPLAHLLADTDLIVLNPRRENFPMDDPNAARGQIEWEQKHLLLADMISFWFCSQTLCPIVLLELGYWLNSVKPLFVGIHPDYKRRQDVEIQTGLARPNVPIVYSLPELAAAVARHTR